MLVVLGPNGAGKSTLLRCLVGVLRPQPGCVPRLGEDVGGLSGQALTRLRRRVAYSGPGAGAGQRDAADVARSRRDRRTGRAGLLRPPVASADWRTGRRLDRAAGSGNWRGQAYSARLSGGEQRKTLLAMAMVQQPEILLLDEPTANLDVYWREQIVTTLETLHREQGLTIVLVCHDLEVIPPRPTGSWFCATVAWLPRAHCHDVLTGNRIEALYGRGLDVLQHGGRYVLVPQTREGRR